MKKRLLLLKSKIPFLSFCLIFLDNWSLTSDPASCKCAAAMIDSALKYLYFGVLNHEIKSGGLPIGFLRKGDLSRLDRILAGN